MLSWTELLNSRNSLVECANDFRRRILLYQRSSESGFHTLLLLPLSNSFPSSVARRPNQARGGRMAAAAAAEEEPCCCISHAFDRAARHDPARLSFVHAAPAAAADDGERRFTCGDLLSAVSSLSRRIAAALPLPAPDPRRDGGSPGACLRARSASDLSSPVFGHQFPCP
jgi:hypothetical protein